MAQSGRCMVALLDCSVGAGLHCCTSLLRPGLRAGGGRLGRRSTPPLLQPCRCQATLASAEQHQVPQPEAPAAAEPMPNVIDDAAADHGGMARVVLKRGKARLFKEGQPMVYSGAVDRVVGRPPPGAGDAVVLADGSNATIGWGAFNPNSMFRVRVLQLLADATARPELACDVPALLRTRIGEAAALRRALGLPSDRTSAYRLCNSEGDRLSGLIADVLCGTIVVSSSSAFIERNKELVVGILREVTGLRDIVWRPSGDMLREEGIEATVTLEAGAEQQAQEPVEIVENGVKYLASPWGQKTGFYIDQRDSRVLVQQLAGGKRVLDLCCYTGGFALNAAVGCAASVTGVDSSVPAVELARRNAALNGLEEGAATFVQDDIMKFMQAAAAESRRYDLIVLDPPKLAPNRKSLQRATRRYQALNAAAMRLLPPEGGLLVTCSCSGAMTQSSGQFLAMLQAAAAAAGRRVSVLRHAGPASDHPTDLAYPEGNYLTNMLLSVT